MKIRDWGMTTTAARAIQKIKELSPDQQANYALALRDSIVWDAEEDDGHPPSPQDLSRWHGIPLDALESQLVLLNKQEAESLLQDVGRPIGGATIRKKVLTADAYKLQFGRKASKVSNRLVFTYVEVMLLSGFSGDLSEPEKLQELISTS